MDLTVTVAELAGVDISDAGLPGGSLVPLLSDPAGGGRDEILFAQDWAWYDGLLNTRYASRGIFDGRFKYCRYYGIGGSSTTSARPPPSLEAGPKLFDIDAHFDDQEHELYDLHEDPHELVNLAVDRTRRTEVRAWFDQERPPTGRRGGGVRRRARQPPRRRTALGRGLGRHHRGGAAAACV